MIRGLVCALDTRARRQEFRGDSVPREFHGGAYITPSTENRFGFPNEEDASAFARAMAMKNPGTTYMWYKVGGAFECPPGEIIEKSINQDGELIKNV